MFRNNGLGWIVFWWIFQNELPKFECLGINYLRWSASDEVWDEMSGINSGLGWIAVNEMFWNKFSRIKFLGKCLWWNV